jgi:endonuclease VIII
MPEGDSIHRIAQRLAPRLAGLTLTQLVARGIPHATADRRVRAVTALGKHLVIALDDGTEIRSHLGMNGVWHRHDPGEPVATNGDTVSLVIGTTRDLFVCRHAVAVEITDRRSAGRGLAVARLGPDLLDPACDLDAVMERVARQRAERTVGGVLMDQRVAAGIGNIWRCESLHRLGIDPRTPISALDPDVVLRLYETAQALLRDATAGNAPERRIHRRAGCPCGERVQTYVLEDRTTFSCPRCQPRHG